VTDRGRSLTLRNDDRIDQVAQLEGKRETNVRMASPQHGDCEPNRLGGQHAFKQLLNEDGLYAGPTGNLTAERARHGHKVASLIPN
jgi:hypothetical protein